MASHTFKISNSMCLINQFIRKLMSYEPELVFIIRHIVEPATKLQIGDLSNIEKMKQNEVDKGYYPSRIDISLEYIVDDCIFELFDKNFTRNLIELNLNKLELLTDKGLIHIGKTCKKLKRITICNCDSISKRGLKKFVKYLPFLTIIIACHSDNRYNGNWALNLLFYIEKKTNKKLEFGEIGKDSLTRFETRIGYNYDMCGGPTYVS